MRIRGLLLSTLSICLAQGLFAETIEEKRQKSVDAYVQDNQVIFDKIIEYVERTGDITPTRAEVQQFHNLSTNYFKTFSQEECNKNVSGYCLTTGGITISVNKNLITLSNVFKDTNNDIQNLYSDSTYLATNTTINGTFTAVTHPISTFAKTVWNTIEEVNLDSTKQYVKNYSSLPTTGSSTIAYYVGNEVNGIDVYAYISGTGYKKLFTIDEANTNADNNAVLTFYKNDGFNPSTTLGFKGWTARVQADDGATYLEYMHDGTEWVVFATNGAGGDGHFEGDATIKQISTELFDYEGGSKATASSPSGEFIGNLDFIKKDNVATGGYWTDSSKMHVVVQNLTQLSTQSWALNAKAFYYVGSKKFYLIRMSVPSYGTTWVYQANGYDDVASNFEDIDTSLGGYVYDSKNAKFFKKTNTKVWTSTDNTVKVTGHADGRSSFTVLNSSFTYYVAYEDCTSTTCNGTSGTGYYAGLKKDNMFTFYFSTGGNRKNNLVDAVPRASIADIYNYGDTAALFNNQVYLKRIDTLGRTVYYNLSNGYYYTKNAVQIPTLLAPRYGTTVNLPSAYNASTITFSGSYVVLTNRTQATDWTSAPNNALVKIGVKNYTHKVGSGLDFWTDNAYGDGQQSATEIFTRGSRSMLPNVNHSIVALTKQLGTEGKWTTSGITSSIDSSFKQWYYASSGLNRTKSLLDDPCLSRTKDGKTMIADFGTSQCYVQASTTSQKIGRIYIDQPLFGGSPFYQVNDAEMIERCVRQEVYRSLPSTMTLGQTLQVASACHSGGCFESNATCQHYKTNYVCSSGYSKLNNSTCEYREGF